MNERAVFFLIFLLIIAIVIFVINRDKVFGKALEPTCKRVFSESKILKLPQIQLKNKSDTFRTFNPSITTLNGKQILSYRVSNFTKCLNSINKDVELSRFNNDIILNHIVLEISKDNFITIKTPNVSASGCIQGFEDPRPIVSPDGKNLYLIVNNRSLEKCEPEMWMIRIKTEIFSDPKVLEEKEFLAEDVFRLQYDKKGPQKNWMPFFLKSGSHQSNVHEQNSLMFVYSVNPHIILKCDTKTGICSTFAETFNPELPTDIRGGSQIQYYNGRYIGFTHVRRSSDTYVTQAYAFSENYPFEVEAITLPFIFDEEEEFKSPIIQFVSGFDILQNTAYITYGEQDCQSKMCKIPMQTLMSAFYEIDPPVKGSIFLNGN